MLFFLQFLEIDERRFVLRVELEYFREGGRGPIDEAAAAIVEAEAEQHVGVFDAVEPRSLQERLMFADRAAHLTLLAVEIAEHELHFERARIDGGGLLEFLDGGIDLIGDEVVQAENEVRRLPLAAPVDPASSEVKV